MSVVEVHLGGMAGLGVGHSQWLWLQEAGFSIHTNEGETIAYLHLPLTGPESPEEVASLIREVLSRNRRQHRL